MRSLVPFLPLALAACMAGPAVPPSDRPVPPPLAPGEWRLVEIDGRPPDSLVTLDLSRRGQISGRAPCNPYAGPVEGREPRFRPGQVVSNVLACPALAEEGRYFAALARVERIERRGAQVILTGPGTRLVFAASRR